MGALSTWKPVARLEDSPEGNLGTIGRSVVEKQDSG